MGTPAIRTEGLTKRYGSSDALLGLDLEVAQGEVVGYLGPNGAGKTTTIRLLLGLARPTAGRAEIFGLDCQHQTVEAHRRLAYVPGEANLWPSLTGADLLMLDEPTSGLDPLMEQAFRRSVQEARDAGQTVFLSSHIMSEVEALCDRVAILREGRLIEMGTLEDLRHLSALSVQVTFDRVPPDLDGVAGVTRAVVEGRRVYLEVQGPIEPLVDALAGTGVRQLLSREPSLEELFLAHYGPDGAAPVLAGLLAGAVDRP